jgi:hypothetical protein
VWVCGVCVGVCVCVYAHACEVSQLVSIAIRTHITVGAVSRAHAGVQTDCIRSATFLSENCAYSGKVCDLGTCVNGVENCCVMWKIGTG